MLVIIPLITLAANFVAHASPQGWPMDYDEDEDRLTLSPEGIGADRSLYVVKANQPFRVACTYENNDVSDPHLLQWINEGGRVIDSNSSPNLFTVSLHVRHTRHVKRSLVFMNINFRDAGTYICQADKGNGELVRKAIQVHVISNLAWNWPEDTISGKLGEPITIDCGARGDPDPADFVITDQHGEPLDEDQFKVAGIQVTIPQLTKAYQGVRVKCVAVQSLPKFNTTTTEQHEVKINVLYEPEFAEPQIEKKAIVGQDAELACIVIDSNPPAEFFKFYRADNSEIINSTKHHIVVEEATQRAFLRIRSIDEEDFSRYRCEVSNGKLHSDQIIVLSETSPPRQPRVTLLRTTNTSVVWRILENLREDGDLPVVGFAIHYMPSDQLFQQRRNLTEIDVAEEARKPWGVYKGSSYTVISKDKAHEYEVTGLLPHTKYTFLFYGRNEAGFGETLELQAETGEMFFTSGSVRVCLSSAVLLLSLPVMLTSLRMLISRC